MPLPILFIYFPFLLLLSNFLYFLIFIQLIRTRNIANFPYSIQVSDSVTFDHEERSGKLLFLLQVVVVVVRTNKIYQSSHFVLKYANSEMQALWVLKMQHLVTKHVFLTESRTCLSSCVNKSGRASLTLKVMAYCLCYVPVNSMQTSVRMSFLVRNLILETRKAQTAQKDTKKGNSPKNYFVGYIVKIME